MAKLTEEMIEAMKKQGICALATASKDGVPNVVPVGMIFVGEDGNIFNLMGIAARTLRQHGLAEQSKEMTKRITDTAQSYDEALGIIGEYVNITSVDDCNKDMDAGMEMHYD